MILAFLRARRNDAPGTRAWRIARTCRLPRVLGCDFSRGMLRRAAGRLNRQKRGPLSDQGRQRLRDAALRNAPWRFSTGPKTPAGKRRAALNGRLRKRGPEPSLKLEPILSDLRAFLSEMARVRSMAASTESR